MHSFRVGLCLVASIVVAGSCAYGATVSGTVKGPDGAPFKGAFVQAQNKKTRITVNVLSGSGGRYRAENLPAGEYDLRIRAIGYRADARTGVTLTAGQDATFDWALQKAAVRWSDLTLYQGEKLLPDLPGKELLFGPTASGGRDAPCQICHGFQTRMASVTRDESGWEDRIQYMRETERFQLAPRINDQDAARLASYLTSLFGPDSVLPKSAADDPEYKSLVRSFPDDAMNIVYVEYDLPGPNRMPFSAVPASDGSVWIPYYGPANKIARLNPQTGEVREFPVPNQGTAAIHSVFPAPDGSVWLAEFGANKLGRWDPKTETITEYADAYLPGKEGLVLGGGKHTVRVGRDGIAWSSGWPLSRFDPESGKFTHFSETTYGVALDKDGNCWFTEYAPEGKIGKVDGKTLKLTTWTPPAAGKVYSRRIQIDSDGAIWFSESEAGKIGRFDPKTQTFKQYPLPGPNPSPYAMNLDRSHQIWYSSEYLDELGRLDPKTGKVTEYPFPHSEITMREFFFDSRGRMWYASPSNNKVGYFYLSGDR
jgi:virginiamycin B lyase